MELRILSIVLFSVVLLVSLNNSRGQSQCLKANNENGLPNYQGMTESGLKSVIFPLQHQAIVPSYKFQCCGTITEWAVSIASDGVGNDTMDVLSLQVWRPSPSVNETGCYTLIGNNNFSSVSLESELTSVTPLPHEQIHFRPGDVLGFYVENSQAVEYASSGVMMLCDLNEPGDRGYETEEVWYATNLVFSNAKCLAAVGPGRLLDSSTNVAPIISVSYTTADHCTAPPPIPAITATRIHTTYGGVSTAIPSTQSPLASNLLPPPIRSADYLIIVGVVLAVLVIVIVTLVAVVAVGMKAKRDRRVKDSLSLVGSGAYATPLLNMPTESVGTLTVISL